MMKKLLSIVVAALAVGACAFHEDKPRGKTWIPEESDASVGTKQKYQGTVPTYGDVPLNTQVESAPAPTVDPGARENLGAAAEQIDGRQVLDEGRNRTDARSSGGGFPWWALAILPVGFGVVAGLRQWANRALPEPPQPKKPQW